jgi:hypothetical protein
MLGDFSVELPKWTGSSEWIRKIRSEGLSGKQRLFQIGRSLVDLILAEPEPTFLLGALLQAIAELGDYSFADFELFLNQHSGLTPDENLAVRSKIVGKKLHRGDYQGLFPIGTGKVYPGTHFVTAHRSPDLDTTIASFWGWVDAFGARVAEGIHVWNVPGGPPDAPIEMEILFKKPFGEAIFSSLPKDWNALSIRAIDLLTQQGFEPLELDASLIDIDHERGEKAVVLVDRDGYYLGDWRHFDLEGVQQVILLFSSCLRWFENGLHLLLISLFAKQELTIEQAEKELSEFFHRRLLDAEPTRSFSPKQRKEVSLFMTQVLFLEEKSTFEQAIDHLFKQGSLFQEIVSGMRREGVFGLDGRLQEDRPRIFRLLERVVGDLHGAIFRLREKLERLETALLIKQKVFGRRPTFVSLRDEVEEILTKMGSYPYLTVNGSDGERLYPLGVISAERARKKTLGTVTLRDFCNRDEMGIPSYLDVISVIDHHKSILSTFAPPNATIGDVQSSNTLVALKAFEINDRYSVLPKGSEGQLSLYLQKRTLTRAIARETKGSCYIHPMREYLEYLHFLYGIIDDTDLLSKVTSTDIEVVVELLNRLKSIATGRESEVIAVDSREPKEAAKAILQNSEMYSLYKKIYAFREKELTHQIKEAASGAPSRFFADTKEQNGCCRIGQTKLFPVNLKSYFEKSHQIQRHFVEKAKKVAEQKPEIDLHLHMISTVVSAEEVYQGKRAPLSHQDELWIWTPSTDLSQAHLKRFLSAFRESSGLKERDKLSLEFLGENGRELSALFEESFLPIAQTFRDEAIPIAVLRFPPGALNSRKATVSPFLPV